MTRRQGKRWWRIVVNWERRQGRRGLTRGSVDSSGGLGATGTGSCSHSSDAPLGATVDSSGNETPEPETLTAEATTTHNGLWTGRLRNRQQKEDARGRGP